MNSSASCWLSVTVGSESCCLREEIPASGTKTNELETTGRIQSISDFRSVKRNPGHKKILQWCIDRGLDFDARAGWMNQTVVSLAAQYGNNEIIESMKQKGIPEKPYSRASIGDLDFVQRFAKRHRLSDLKDEKGFNLLFYCAGSGLGRRDEPLKRRLA